MNKLASIFYLQKMGLHTINPNIVRVYTEKEVREYVDSFYDKSTKWVLRCGEFPDERAKIERMLPWAVANTKEDLVKKILELQKDIGKNYFVFCHEFMDMVRGGVMLVEGDKVIIEAGEGNPQELSAMFRGYRNPEQLFVFNSGMLSFKDSGKKVLSTDDLLDVRNIERRFDWRDIGAITDSVLVEFSRIRDGHFYVHDLRFLS